jgi:small subunit ribosomal protein S21
LAFGCIIANANPQAVKSAQGNSQGKRMSLRMRVHDREPIGAALRRFKKLLERSGLTKELRKRKYYEKPCEARRRDEMRKKNNIRKGKTKLRTGPSYW